MKIAIARPVDSNLHPVSNLIQYGHWKKDLIQKHFTNYNCYAILKIPLKIRSCIGS